ncbi:MAG TPA: hypothetical protein VM911_04195 [Pyrinomonadaceae bacterium]|nr:hypothetical protein [Pyrinomonadaceae bacterium]
MIKHAIICCLLILASSSLLPSAFAQEKPAWLREVELVLQKEPRWKIKETKFLPIDMPTVFNEAIVLKSGPLRADITITASPSEEWAKDGFEQERVAFSAILGKNARATRVPDLGDDNYMLAGRKRTSLFFRKGKVTVKVFAPSVETAKRFARHVADKIPPSNDSF